MNREQLLIEWNNKFPSDRKFRQKYNIPFNSSQHKQISQIDVYLDAFEDTMFERYKNLYLNEQNASSEYKSTGKWLKDHTLNEKNFNDLFDKIDIHELNKKQQ